MEPWISIKNNQKVVILMILSIRNKPFLKTFFCKTLNEPESGNLKPNIKITVKKIYLKMQPMKVSSICFPLPAIFMWEVSAHLLRRLWCLHTRDVTLLSGVREFSFYTTDPADVMINTPLSSVIQYEAVRTQSTFCIILTCINYICILYQFLILRCCR